MYLRLLVLIVFLLTVGPSNSYAVETAAEPEPADEPAVSEETAGEEEAAEEEAVEEEVEVEIPEQSEWSIKGQGFYGEGKYAEAVDAFTKALAENSEDSVSYLGRAQAYLELKKYKEAIADFDKALEAFPEDVPAHIGRGRPTALR